MKTIISMLTATILALYTFCSVCWYASSNIFDSVMQFVFVALSRVSSGGVCGVQTPMPGAGVSGHISITWRQVNRVGSRHAGYELIVVGPGRLSNLRGRQ